MRLASGGLFVGSKTSIPEEIDHREIAVPLPVVGKVQFLLASEPSKSSKPRTLYVVFFIKENVHVERRRAGNRLGNEDI